MKRFTILIATAMMLFLMLSTAFAVDYHYFVFDNLDDQKGHQEQGGVLVGVQWNNLIDLYYWERFETRENWAPYSKKVPFGSSTFSQYPTEDMDVAVIPLGTSYVLSSKVGGVSILDKVKELLDAGKGVIVIGSAILLDSDAEAQSWLSDDLGIDLEKNGVLSLMNGNTYVNYKIQGNGSDDPIFGAIGALFNGGEQQNGGDWNYPSRYYQATTAFQLKDDATATRGALVAGNTDYSVALWKEYPSGGKLVLWVSDWANVATYNDLMYPYTTAIEWIVESLPSPGGLLETETEDLDFGSVTPGESFIKTLKFRNNGRKDLTITDMYFYNEDYNKDHPEEEPLPLAFSLDGDQSFPMVIPPGGKDKVKVTFSPLLGEEYKDYDYSDDLVIINDGMSKNTAYIGLSGVGGKKTNYAPWLNVFETDIDFGKGPIGKSYTREAVLINDGQADLVLQKLEFEDEVQEDFQYGQTYKMPQILDPGGEYAMLLKFVPLEADKKYSTTMYVETNGQNDDYEMGTGNARLFLNGQTISDKAPADCIIIGVGGEELKFGKCSEAKDTTITIMNTGEELLTVFDILFDDETTEYYSAPMFSWEPSEEFTIEPGEEAEFTITFNPTSNHEFYGTLNVYSNAPGSHAHHYIWLHGDGEDIIAVNEDMITGITTNVYPNPVSNNSVLELNIDNTTISNLDIKVVDMQGRTIQTIANDTYATGTYNFNINPEDWAAGKYFIVLTTEKKQTMIPIIKE